MEAADYAGERAGLLATERLQSLILRNPLPSSGRRSNFTVVKTRHQATTYKFLISWSKERHDSLIANVDFWALALRILIFIKNLWSLS